MVSNLHINTSYPHFLFYYLFLPLPCLWLGAIHHLPPPLPLSLFRFQQYLSAPPGLFENTPSLNLPFFSLSLTFVETDNVRSKVLALSLLCTQLKVNTNQTLNKGPLSAFSCLTTPSLAFTCIWGIETVFFKQVYLFREEENETSCALLIGVPPHCLFTSRRAEAVFGNWFLNCRRQSWTAFQIINNEDCPVLRSCAYHYINTTKHQWLLPFVTSYLFSINIRHGVFTLHSIREAVSVVSCSMETTEIEMLRVSLVVIRNKNIRGMEDVGCFEDSAREARLRWFACGRRRTMNRLMDRRMVRLVLADMRTGGWEETRVCSGDAFGVRGEDGDRWSQMIGRGKPWNVKLMEKNNKSLET